jgi:hypothetical protein
MDDRQNTKVMAADRDAVVPENVLMMAKLPKAPGV